MTIELRRRRSRSRRSRSARCSTPRTRTATRAASARCAASRSSRATDGRRTARCRRAGSRSTRARPTRSRRSRGPLAPNLTLRTFDVPDTVATQVRFTALENQCTGGPAYQGEQDADPRTRPTARRLRPGHGRCTRPSSRSSGRTSPAEVRVRTSTGPGKPAPFPAGRDAPVASAGPGLRGSHAEVLDGRRDSGDRGRADGQRAGAAAAAERRGERPAGCAARTSTSRARTASGRRATRRSKVWFTVADGVLSDVYYPTVDNTNVETLQYVVTDGSTFTDLQTRDMTYTRRGAPTTAR